MLQSLTESPALSSMISTQRLGGGDGFNETFFGIKDGCCRNLRNIMFEIDPE